MAVSDRTRSLVAVSCGVTLFGFAACAFPDHSFVDDDQFYGTDSGTSGGFGGASGGAGGTGAGGTGATGATGATGGASGGAGGASGTGGASGGTTGGSGGATGGAGGATGGSGGVTGGSGGVTGGSGGVTGGAGGATGGAAGNENCTNGIDDNNDTLVDCQDPKCQSGFTCVPVLPAGWSGPLALYAGAGPAPDCLTSGGYPTVKQNANSGLNPGSASCPTCTCDGTTGVGCEASIILMTDGTCAGGPCWGGEAGLLQCGSAPFNNITVPNGLACSLLPTLISSNGAGAKGAWMGPLTSTGGVCAPKSTGSKTIPTPTWNQTIRACGDGPTTGKGCGTGKCMPRPAGGFGNSVCIHRVGDQACPAPFSTKTLAHLNYSDARDCSACACDPPNPLCTGTLTLYTDDLCSANQTTIVTPDTCNSIPVDPDPLLVFPPGTGGMPPADTRSVGSSPPGPARPRAAR